MLGFTIGKVQGRSMLPRILHNSFVLCLRLPHFFYKKIGAVYYINHPKYGPIVKTLAAVHENGSLEFCGESKDSISQKSLGKLTYKHIIGRVVWVIYTKKSLS